MSYTGTLGAAAAEAFGRLAAARADRRPCALVRHLLPPGETDAAYAVQPNWTEHPEPCGVNWTTPGGVTSSLHPRRP